MTPTQYPEISAQIIEIGRRLYAREMVSAADGNISARVADGTILITRSGAEKGFLTPKDIVRIDSTGKLLAGEGSPSSEMGMHLEVYRSRPDICACVHSHAPYCTACAVAGVVLPGDILPEVVALVGEIVLTAYAPPGTPAVGKSLHPGLASANAFILKNHGLLTLGRDLSEAHRRHETVESYARVYAIARALGNTDHLAPEEVARLRALFG